MKLASNLILTLILLNTTLLAAASKAGSAVCQFCGQEISGQYLSYQLDTGTLIVCTECERELGHCARCGIPVTGTRSADKHVICRQCRLHAPKCDVCGEILVGQYLYR